MSRLDASRWRRILAWTGATLTWGAALTASQFEALRAEPAATEPRSAAEDQVPLQEPLPTQPPGGLVILRYTPVEDPQPDVHTVYVKQSAPSAPSSTRSASSPAPAPAPAPTSSGS